MEQLVTFNNVRILFTTAEHLDSVQNFLAEADVVISVYPDAVKILRGPESDIL